MLRFIGLAGRLRLFSRRTHAISRSSRWNFTEKHHVRLVQLVRNTSRDSV